mmetsp:Transcript_64950/g.186643  ORF Transcript_64950/g.186643 Transcript_64950/m.186643 type:complete len:220 (+) Transcript_64950:1696-2355(+)
MLGELEGHGCLEENVRGVQVCVHPDPDGIEGDHGEGDVAEHLTHRNLAPNSLLFVILRDVVLLLEEIHADLRLHRLRVQEHAALPARGASRIVVGLGLLLQVPVLVPLRLEEVVAEAHRRLQDFAHRRPPARSPDRRTSPRVAAARATQHSMHLGLRATQHWMHLGLRRGLPRQLGPLAFSKALLVRSMCAIPGRGAGPWTPKPWTSIGIAFVASLAHI